MPAFSRRTFGRSGVFVTLAMVASMLSTTARPALADTGWSAASVSTFAGSGASAIVNGTGAGASFSAPQGMHVTGGFGYVFDSGYLRKVSLSTGVVSTVAGTGTPGYGDSVNPATASVNGSGPMADDGTFLYFTNTCGGYSEYSCLRKMSLATGAVSTMAQQSTNPPYSALVIGPGGALYGSTGSTVERIDTVNNTSAVAVTISSGSIASMTADSSYLWLAVSGGSSAVVRADATTGATTGFAAGAGQSAYGPITSMGSYLYVMSGYRVVQFTKATGATVVLAGQTSSSPGFVDGTGSQAWFGYVAGLESDGTALWVTDGGNRRVRRLVAAAPLPQTQPAALSVTVSVAPATVSTFAGSGTSAVVDGTGAGASFAAPGGMHVVAGYGYLFDSGYLRKVNLSTSAVSTVAGTGTLGYGDSVNPATASLNGSGRMADDGTFLYFTNTCGGYSEYSCLRRMSLATGAISTMAQRSAYGAYSALVIGADGALYGSSGNTIERIDTVSNTTTVLAVLPLIPDHSGPLGTYYLNILSMTADHDFLWAITTDTASGGFYSECCTSTVKVDVRTGAVSTLIANDNAQQAHANGQLVSAGSYLYGSYVGDVQADGSAAHGVARWAKATGVLEPVAAVAVAGLDVSGGALFAVDDAQRKVLRLTRTPTPTEPGGPFLPGETTGGSNPAEITCQCQHVDPVNTATGSLFENVTDLSLPGRGLGASFGRGYDSQRAAIAGPVGYGWTATDAMTLTADATTPGLLASVGVIDVTQDNGSIVRFARNTDGSYSAASRVLAQLVQNGDGTFTFTRHRRTIFRFDAAGRLRTARDLNGYTTTMGYDASNRLSSIADPAGRTLLLAYTSDSHVQSVTDAAGRIIGYGYNAAGELTSVTDPAGKVTGYGYDGAHRLTSLTDPRGGVTTTGYDTAGKVISQTDPASRTTTFSYTLPTDTGSWVATITDPRGKVTRETYTHAGLTALTKGLGTPSEATTSYTADPVTDAITATTDPLGHTTSATYDSDGNTLTATDGLGHFESWTYDGLDEPLTHVDRNGVTTTNTYDSSGNLLSSSTPLVGSSPLVSATSTLAYADGAHPGDVTGITNARGKTSQRTYDSYGQLTASTDPLGQITTTNYTCTPAGPGCRSNIGWAYRTVSPKGNVAGGIPADYTTVVTRDDIGRILTGTDPLGHTRTTSYDNNGNPSIVTDANNHTTSYTYNADNQVTVVTRPDQSTLGSGYDSAGNLTSQTNGAGKITSYAYDPLNRVASSTDPLARTTSRSYDLVGRPATVTDPAGRVTTYGYDNANRRTSVSFSDGVTSNVTYGYDNDGRRTTMTDSTGTSSYSTDSLGRLTSTTNGAGRITGYGYDLNGNTTSITYAAGQVLTRAFDNADQLTSLTDWNAHTSTFGYDSDGNLATTGYANGVSEAIAVNRAGQVTSVADTQGASTLASYSYTRDPVGLLTSTTPTGATGQTNESYAHSTLDQLTTYTTAGRNGSYSYDTADNLTRLANNTAQIFDIGNQLAAATPAITLTGTAKAGDSGTTSSLTLTLPAGTSANDQILVSATMPQSKTVTTPTGYTIVGNYTSGTATTSARMVVFRRTALAGDTNVVVAFGTKFAKAVTLAVYRGVDPTSPIDATASSSTTAGTSVTAPAVTTPQPNDQVVILDGENNSTTAPTWTVPSGTTSQTSQAGGLTVAAAIADTSLALAGSTSTKTSTLSVAGNLITALVALKPIQTTYGYDNRGNRTTITPSVGTATTLGYDQANRLISYGPASTYRYNGDGLRASKTVSGTTSPYTWDFGGSLPLLLADGTSSYIYGPGGLLIEQVDSVGTATYIQHDQQGSTRVLTSQAATVTGTYTYNGYGQTINHTGTAATPLLYTGQYTDTETGLYYLRARYYDPSTAQFLTRDPLEAKTRSTYGYLNGRPLDGIDPSGLASCALGQNGGGCADGSPLPPGFDNFAAFEAHLRANWRREDCEAKSLMKNLNEASKVNGRLVQLQQRINDYQSLSDYYGEQAKAAEEAVGNFKEALLNAAKIPAACLGGAGLGAEAAAPALPLFGPGEVVDAAAAGVGCAVGIIAVLRYDENVGDHIQNRTEV